MVRTLLKEVCLRGSPYFPFDFGLNYVSNLTYIWLSTLRIKMVSSTVYRMVNMNVFLSFILSSLVSLQRILLMVILVLKTIHIFIILHDPPPHTHTLLSKPNALSGVRKVWTHQDMVTISISILAPSQ